MKNHNEITATMVNLMVFSFVATLFVLIFFFPEEFGQLMNAIKQQIK